MHRTLRGSFLTLLFGLLVCGCSSGPETGPAQTVEQFYRHLNDRDYAAAKSLYSAEARQVLEDPSSASDEGFAEWARLETKNGSVDAVRTIQEEADDTNATVEFEVVYGDGSRANHTVSLTLEQDGWKLGLIG